MEDRRRSTESGARPAHCWRPNLHVTLRRGWSSFAHRKNPPISSSTTCPYSAPRSIFPFPAWESELGERIVHDEIYGQRLRTLKQLDLARPANDHRADRTGHRVEHSKPACSQYLHRKRSATARVVWRSATRSGLRTCDIGWSSSGFITPAPWNCRVNSRHEADCSISFAADWERPVRVELFGDEIESIRRFEVSFATQHRVAATSRDHRAVAQERANAVPFTAHVPAGTWFLLIEPEQIRMRRNATLAAGVDRRVLQPAAINVPSFKLLPPRRPPSHLGASGPRADCRLNRSSDSVATSAKCATNWISSGGAPGSFVWCTHQGGIGTIGRDPAGHSAPCCREPCTLPGQSQHGFRSADERSHLDQRSRTVSARRAAPHVATPTGQRPSTAFSICAKAIWSCTWPTGSAAIAACR